MLWWHKRNEARKRREEESRRQQEIANTAYRAVNHLQSIGPITTALQNLTRVVQFIQQDLQADRFKISLGGIGSALLQFAAITVGVYGAIFASDAARSAADQAEEARRQNSQMQKQLRHDDRPLVQVRLQQGQKLALVAGETFAVVADLKNLGKTVARRMNFNSFLSRFVMTRCRLSITIGH